MAKSVAIGTYPVVNFFLKAIGESQTNWQYYRDYLIAYWVNQNLSFELLDVNGEVYINVKTAISNYTPMPSPLANITVTSSGVWIESQSKDACPSTWTTTINNAITDAEIRAGAYQDNMSAVRKTLQDKKTEYYNSNGDIPVYVTKTTYAKKS